MNAGRLAYYRARLYQETKDPLWKAKAEALAGSVKYPAPWGLSKNVCSGRIPFQKQG